MPGEALASPSPPSVLNPSILGEGELKERGGLVEGRREMQE